MAKKEIKSTLEIAMEKLARMPEATPEEIIERREKEFGRRGRAIANRYLEGALQLTDLEIEICKFQGEDAEVIRRTLRESLCGAIGLEEMERSRNALEALQALEKGVGLEGRAEELEGIYTEYLRQREQTLAELEGRERDRLRQLGISGSAVRPNPEASQESQQRLQETRQAFSSRVEDLRAELLQPVARSGSD